MTGIVLSPKGSERKQYSGIGDLAWDDATDEVAGRFSEYFAGARSRLDLPYLVPEELDSFARRVLRETARIPYGKRRTHQQIAQAAGNRNAYRQVLATLMVNPLPLLVPCHRVVPAGTGIGSWIGGTRKKAWLLKLESQNPDDR